MLSRENKLTDEEIRIWNLMFREQPMLNEPINRMMPHQFNRIIDYLYSLQDCAPAASVWIMRRTEAYRLAHPDAVGPTCYSAMRDFDALISPGAS